MGEIKKKTEEKSSEMCSIKISRLQPLDRATNIWKNPNNYLTNISRKTGVHAPKRTGDTDRVVLAAADLLDDIARGELLHEVRREIRVVALVQVAQLAHAAVAPGEDLTLVCACANKTRECGRENEDTYNESGKSSVMTHNTDQKKYAPKNEERTDIDDKPKANKKHAPVSAAEWSPPHAT
jgi:hypothetical protein